MYYIGIDISKFKHDCAVIDDVGDVVTPSWSFANDHEGVTTSPTSSITAQSCLNLEMSIPM